MHRELGDLVAQAIELGSGACGSQHVGGERVHGESPPATAILYARSEPTCAAPQAAIAARSAFFAKPGADVHGPPSVCRWRRIRTVRATRHGSNWGNLASGKRRA